MASHSKEGSSIDVCHADADAVLGGDGSVEGLFTVDIGEVGGGEAHRCFLWNSNPHSIKVRMASAFVIFISIAADSSSIAISPSMRKLYSRDRPKPEPLGLPFPLDLCRIDLEEPVLGSGRDDIGKVPILIVGIEEPGIEVVDFGEL